MVSEEHIGRLFKENAQNSRIVTGFSQTLESNIRTVFNKGYKFIYELLQNADDAKASRVKFIFYENKLLISHDGSSFTVEDVERICTNASQEGEKVNNLDKTGYKGVGFKAVFCISSKVTIISTPYCFRFDKSECEKHETKPFKLPWPIIPILTSKNVVEQEIHEELSDELVHFLIEVDSIENTQSELALVFDSPEILLVLRNVNHIELKINGKTAKFSRNISKVEDNLTDVKIENLKNSANSIMFQSRVKCKYLVELIANTLDGEQFNKLYYLYQTPIALDKHPIKKKLEKLTAAECPEKLRRTDWISIIFAAQLEECKLIRQSNTRLNCYLPTGINAGLPFWVNADFILDQDRTSLLSNDWNKFLLETIARKQFEWFADLSRDSVLRKSVLNLLPELAIKSIQDELKIPYQNGFKEGLRKTEFIPSLTPNTSLTFFEAIIDETGFFSDFSSDINDPLCKVKDKLEIVDPVVSGIEYLLQFKIEKEGIKKYTYDDLFKRIEGYLKEKEKHGTLPIRILQFFMKLYHEFHGRIQGLPLILVDKRILLTTQGRFLQPKLCYLPEGNTSLLSEFNLFIVDSCLVSNANIVSWLRDTLEVATLNEVDIIRHTIIEDIIQEKIDQEKSFKYLRFLYDVFARKNQNKLTEEDYSKLSGLLVLVKDASTYKPVGSCFHDNCVNVPHNMIISEKYYQKGDNFDVWYELLLCLKIKTTITLKFHQSLSSQKVSKILESFGEDLTEYFNTFKDLVREDNHLSNSPSKPNISSQFREFVAFDDFKSIKEKSTYHIFWQSIKSSWQKLSQTQSTYVHSGQSAHAIGIVPYVIYFLKTKKCVRILGSSEFAATGDLFVRYPQDNFEGLPLPIADIPITLNLSEALFLGFKIRPTLEDCLQLLDNSSCSTSPQKLRKIYKLLIELNPTSIRDINKINEWKEKGRLLSESNVLVVAKILTVNDVNARAENESDILHSCGLDAKELAIFANIFVLKTLSQRKQNLTIELHEKDLAQERRDIIIEMVLDCLPLIAVLRSQKNTAAPIDILKEMLDNFYSFNFQYCKTLCLNFENKKVNHVYQHVSGNFFYFRGRWSKLDEKRTIALAIGVSCLKISEDDILKKFSDCLIGYPNINIEDEFDSCGVDINASQQLNSFIEHYIENLPTNNPNEDNLLLNKSESSTRTNSDNDNSAPTLSRRNMTDSSQQSSTINNQAIKLFLGDGTILNGSHLEFKTWYHPDICHYLLQMSNNSGKCIRVIFPDELGNNTQLFKRHLEVLIKLGIYMKKMAVFISKEPGASNHFVCGLIRNNQLLLINPLGITTHQDCYRTLAELKAEGILGTIWLSSHSLQRREYEGESLYSCGPFSLELITYIIGNLTVEQLENFWNSELKAQEPTLHKLTQLEYFGTTIKTLLSPSLKSLLTNYDQGSYQEGILSMRRKHLKQLETSTALISKLKKISELEYIEKCKNEAVSQVVFNMLLHEDITFENIQGVSEYILLCDELNSPENLISTDRSELLDEAPGIVKSVETVDKNANAPSMSSQLIQFELHKGKSNRDSFGRYGHKRKSGIIGLMKRMSINETDLLERGKKGEQAFYDYLLKQVRNSKLFSRVEEIEDGFRGYSIEAPKKCTLLLVWPNKKIEKYQSLDMKLTYNEREFIFEVKSTISSQKPFVHLSSYEWENMMKFKENYALVCVYSVDDDANRKIAILWNPCKHIFMNNLKPADCILRWKYKEESDTKELKCTEVELNKIFGEDEPEIANNCVVQ